MALIIYEDELEKLRAEGRDWPPRNSNGTFMIKPRSLCWHIKQFFTRRTDSTGPK